MFYPIRGGQFLLCSDRNVAKIALVGKPYRSLTRSSNLTSHSNAHETAFRITLARAFTLELQILIHERIGNSIRFSQPSSHQPLVGNNASQVVLKPSLCGKLDEESIGRGAMCSRLVVHPIPCALKRPQCVSATASQRLRTYHTLSMDCDDFMQGFEERRKITGDHWKCEMMRKITDCLRKPQIIK